MKELKTLKGFIEFVNDGWGDEYRTPNILQAKQMISIGKMLVISEDIGMHDSMIWVILSYKWIYDNDTEWVDENMGKFIRICERENLFEPFKPQ